MKKFLVLSLIVVFLVCSGLPVFSQTSSWEATKDAYEEMQRQQRRDYNYPESYQERQESQRSWSDENNADTTDPYGRGYSGPRHHNTHPDKYR